MGDLEQRKKEILSRLGDAGLDVLRSAGIDVDSGIMHILEKQAEKKRELELQASSGSVDDMMTSELVYKSASLEDVYGTEFTRRLQLIALDHYKISSLYQLDSLILSARDLKDERAQPWSRRYFFIDKQTTPDNLPAKGLLTLSELILITDDASSAFARDHEALSGETWAAVCKAAVQAGAHYAFGLRERVEKLNWNPAQEGAFVKNECMLTERLKWGYDAKPAWTAQTTDLSQYQM